MLCWNAVAECLTSLTSSSLPCDLPQFFLNTFCRTEKWHPWITMHMLYSALCFPQPCCICTKLSHCHSGGKPRTSALELCDVSCQDKVTASTGSQTLLMSANLSIFKTIKDSYALLLVDRPDLIKDFTSASAFVAKDHKHSNHCLACSVVVHY